MGSRCFLASKWYKRSPLKNWLTNWFRCPIRILAIYFSTAFLTTCTPSPSLPFRSLSFLQSCFPFITFPFTPYTSPYQSPSLSHSLYTSLPLSIHISLHRFLPFFTSLSHYLLSLLLLFLIMSLPAVFLTSPLIHLTPSFSPCLFLIYLTASFPPYRLSFICHSRYSSLAPSLCISLPLFLFTSLLPCITRFPSLLYTTPPLFVLLLGRFFYGQ